MELKLKIGYQEILELILQLPTGKIILLKNELAQEYTRRKAQEEHGLFQKMLLSGPVMNDDQYEDYLTQRRHFNQWRTN